jgi:hypothetical protein
MKFMEYWKQLDKTVPVMQGHQKTMEKLNRLRVDLKHHGIIPHKMETEACRVNVASFVDAVVSAVFATEIEKVSMVDLIHNQKAKSKLVEANGNMERDEISNALLNIAIAFQEIIRDYEDERAELYRKAPFEFAREEYLRSSTNYVIDAEQKDLVGTIVSLQNAIRIIALGIDFQRYSRFKSMTPGVENDGKGGWEPSFYFQAILEDHVDRNDYRLPSKVECQFCFDFVIETAIRLQELGVQIASK